jgi:hypothetical protein
MDNIILVQEEIHSNKARGDKGIIIKIDMENVFDQVRNNFFGSFLALTQASPIGFMLASTHLGLPP